VISDPTAAVVHPHAAAADRRRQRIKLLLETMIQNRGKILDLITEASESHDHIALGFKSWTDYVRTEYAGLLTRLTVEDRRETVLILSRTGLSTRAIAPIVGTNHSTIVRDLQSGGADAPPAASKIAGVPNGTPDLAGESDDSPADEQEIQPDEQAFVLHFGMRPDIADGLISSGLVTNRKEFDEIADKIRDDRVIVGLDEKRYTAKKRKAMRRPLPTAWQDALYQLGKDVERLERLAADDRFPGHKDDLSFRSRHPLANASKKLWQIRKALGGAE